MRLAIGLGCAVWVVCLSLTAHAFTAFKSGNDLFAECNDSNPFHQGTCLGYITGIADEVTIVDVAHNRGRCIPENASIQQVADVVMKFLRENPEIRNRAAADLETAAIVRAWGCPKK